MLFSPDSTQKVEKKLIHVASLRRGSNGVSYLFLRWQGDNLFIWNLEEKPGIEVKTEIWGRSIKEALFSAYRAWRLEEITPLNCGFRYLLPERDEVGANALFHQMAASYTSSSGIYYDEEVGSSCIVQFASLEARQLLERLKYSKRL